MNVVFVVQVHVTYEGREAPWLFRTREAAERKKEELEAAFDEYEHKDKYVSLSEIELTD